MIEQEKHVYLPPLTYSPIAISSHVVTSHFHLALYSFFIMFSYVHILIGLQIVIHMYLLRDSLIDINQYSVGKYA